MLRRALIALFFCLIAIASLHIEGNCNAASSCAVAPELQMSPTEGLVDTLVTVKGTGFVKNERLIEIRYYLNGAYVTVANGITANLDGNWERSFKVPTSKKGNQW